MTKIYYENKQIEAEFARVSFHKNPRAKALLEVKGEKNRKVYAYIGLEGDYQVVKCYDKPRKNICR